MKHVIITIGLLALVSCKDSKPQEVTTTPKATEQPVEAVKEHQDEESSNVYGNTWINDIVMNNGEKWEADKTTKEGVQQLQNTINSQSASTLEEYHQLADQLNEQKNFLVKNCTMVGPSHDNLHVWLHPLIEKINALLKTESIEDAAKITNSIEKNINAYSEYFK